MNIKPKKSELEAARQTIKFFETLLRATTDGIVITDTTLNIIVANEAFCDIFGRHRNELIETNLSVWLEQLDPGAIKRWTELENQLHVKGFCPNVEFQITEKEKKRHFNVNASLLEQVACEETGAIISIWRDVTEWKEAQNLLEKYAKKLKQANEEVKQFAYIISHDLRAPLVNIKGYSTELRYAADEISSLMSSVTPHLNEEQKESLSRVIKEDMPEALGFIESSANKMDYFISAILKLSHLGRHKLIPEKIDTRSIVESVLNDMAHQIEKCRAKITFGTLPPIIADKTSIEQIVGNILNNALKYHAPERQLKIDIAAEQADKEITIHVCDNGRGIAADDMDKVFAPFRRAGEQNVPGEGMGLSYVQAIVRRHGGQIWCESEQNVGTTFSFTIPAK